MDNFIDVNLGVTHHDSIKYFTHHKNAIEIEYSEVKIISDCVKAQVNNPKFKVLKITNCANVENIEKICNTEDFRNALRDSTHWFFVVFEVTEVPTPRLMLPIIDSFNCSKPLIFQATSADESVLFEKSDRHFGSFEGSLNLNEINNNVHSSHHGSSLFSLIFDYVMKNGIPSGGDLLHLTFDVNEVWSSDDVRRLHQASQNNDDILCLRFLMLYEWDLSKQNKVNRRVLEMDAFSGTPETLAALLDLLFDVNTELLMISEDRSSLLNLVDPDGMSILMRAAMYFASETLQYLIRCGTNVHYIRTKVEDEVSRRFSYESASDIAYSCQRFDIFRILLEADGLFPMYFDPTQVQNDDIREIANERIKFFSDMQQGKLNEVQMFLNRNLSLKRIFSVNNEAAIKVAGDFQKQNSNSGELVKLLISHGCWYADDSYFQETVQEELVKNFPDLKDGYIHRLLSRTRFANSSQTEHHKYDVEAMYRRLDEIPMTQTLMRVVQHHPDLDIIFNFDKRSIVSINPTANLGTFGSVLFKIGRIYIGAKSDDREKKDVIGTLAHEMTHLGMQMLYDNYCKPYRVDHHESASTFGKIVEIYYKILLDGKRYDDIVESVYRYYDQNLWPAELIVRVPHMTGCRGAINSNGISIEFPELSEFYTTKVQPDIDLFVLEAKKYKGRMMIAKLNKTLGNFDRSANIELIRDKFAELNVRESSAVQIIATTQPNLMVCCLKQKFQTASVVFATIHQIPLFHQDLEYVHDYQGALLVIAFTGNYDFANYQECETFFKNLNVNQKLLLIQNSKCKTDNEKINENFRNKVVIPVNELKWSDLTEASRKKVSTSFVSFQGVPVPLNKLFSDNSDGLDDLNLESFFTNEKIEVGECLPLSVGYDSRYFIQRDFKTEEYSSKVFSTENFDHEQLASHKNVIVYGAAGMGKSSVLTNIALQLKIKKPTYWIEKVDLQKISDNFELNITEDGDILMSDTTEDLLINGILESKYPKILFQLLENDRLILMFDGFDEIEYSSRLMFFALLNLLQDTSVNQIWVTTRGEYLKELKDLPDKLEVTLRPFDRSDQIKFIVEYWQSIIGYSNNIRLKQIAATLIDKFEQCIKQKLGNLLDTPLQSRMLAEILIPDQYLNITYPKVFDAYNLYNQFISARLQILYKEKNFSGNYVDIWKAGWEAHERIAMNDSKVLDPFKLKLLKYNPNDSVQFITPKGCTKIGLLQLNADSEIEFIHRTFAEFFIAHFIANQLVNSGFETSIELTHNIVISYFLNSYLNQNEGIQGNLPKIAEKLIAKQKEDKKHLKKFLEYCKRNNLDGAQKVLEHSIVSIKEDIKDLQKFKKLFSIYEDDENAIETVWFSKVIAEAEKGISSE